METTNLRQAAQASGYEWIGVAEFDGDNADTIAIEVGKYDVYSDGANFRLFPTVDVDEDVVNEVKGLREAGNSWDETRAVIKHRTGLEFDVEFLMSVAPSHGVMDFEVDEEDGKKIELDDDSFCAAFVA